MSKSQSQSQRAPRIRYMGRTWVDYYGCFNGITFHGFLADVLAFSLDDPQNWFTPYRPR